MPKLGCCFTSDCNQSIRRSSSTCALHFPSRFSGFRFLPYSHADDAVHQLQEAILLVSVSIDCYCLVRSFVRFCTQ